MENFLKHYKFIINNELDIINNYVGCFSNYCKNKDFINFFNDNKFMSDNLFTAIDDLERARLSLFKIIYKFVEKE